MSNQNCVPCTLAWDGLKIIFRTLVTIWWYFNPYWFVERGVGVTWKLYRILVEKVPFIITYKKKLQVCPAKVDQIEHVMTIRWVSQPVLFHMTRSLNSHGSTYHSGSNYIKWDASSRWLFDTNSACDSIETTIIGKTQPSLSTICSIETIRW